MSLLLYLNKLYIILKVIFALVYGNRKNVSNVFINFKMSDNWCYLNQMLQMNQKLRHKPFKVSRDEKKHSPGGAQAVVRKCYTK